MSVGPRLVSVCVCTFKRPHLLRRTLEGLAKVRGQNEFKLSLVIADNDSEESARETVEEFRARASFDVVYCVEPVQNIALARNRAVQNATGDFIAFIDDDEFPEPDWLANHLRALDKYGADGTLGPVRPFFDHTPPEWLVRGRFCERPEYETGYVLPWRETRTGNVLLRKAILDGDSDPFRQEFGSGGEDQDFFQRMIEKGHRFVWCNEAVVHEVVPEERCQRGYMLRRAFLRGQNERYHLSFGSIAKSFVAIPIYTVSLPILFLAGQHRFMKSLIRLMDHAGKLLAAAGIRRVGEKYLGA